MVLAASRLRAGKHRPTAIGEGQIKGGSGSVAGVPQRLHDAEEGKGRRKMRKYSV